MKYDRTSLAIVTLMLGLFPATSRAQIVPDSSLPVNSIVAPNGNIFTINGGTAAGGNLFHSFSDFSLPTGTEAFFNNSLDVQNIFSRVTGGNISNIDGLIRANGTANLFLLNPNGIVFGPNARLDIGGSFLGTTADSIRFADGVEFSAQNPQAPPLLTVNVPIGLQMGQNPDAITIGNTGHRLAFPINPFVSSPDRSNNPVGLSVNAGNTLALVGGEIHLDGGVLNAASGHIELGSASHGTVSFNTSSSTWNFDYSNLQQFGNIQLSHQSLADASGTPAGSIHFQGRNISLNDASAALLINQGSGNSGDITVNASELLELRGTGNEEFPQSLLRVDNFGEGAGGNIVVSAPTVFLQDGGSFHGFNFGEGTGSNISVEIGDLLEIVGVSPISGFASSLNTRTASSGKSGDIRVVTNRLQILDGAVIGNSSSGTGLGGNTTIDASDFIEVSGKNSQNLADSVIVVGTFSSANAGQLTIDTPTLTVRDGGGIVASTVNSGNGGDVVINASETIEVSGVGRISGLPSRIGARAELLAPPIRQLFGLPDTISGNTGSLLINTPSLQVTDGAIVGVDHQGIGDAGNLQLNANSVLLDRGGSLAASTLSGEGGSLDIRANDLLLIRHDSVITATAGGTGNGGNIVIDSPTIVGLENSDIIANAFQGRGGNIDITTQGIFGLEHRPQLTPESDITASSQFGVNGTVQITNPEVDPSSSLVNFSQEVVDPSEQVVAGCQWTADSEFVATGRGGVPANPNRPLSSSRTWSDVRDLSEFRGETVESASVRVETPQRLVEATGWVINEDGKVELVATANPSPSGNFAASGCNPRSGGEFPSSHRETAVEIVR